MSETEEPDKFVVGEFQQWFATHQSGKSADMILFLQEHHMLKDGAVRMEMAFSDDTTFTIVCPVEYPNGKNLHFDIRSNNERLKKDWLQKIRTYAAENRGQVKLPAILSKCIEYNKTGCASEVSTSGSSMPYQFQDSDSDYEGDEDGGSGSVPNSSDGEVDLLYGDENFTTQTDIEMDVLKKQWWSKEKEIREKLAADGKFSLADYSIASSSFATAASPSASPSTAPKSIDSTGSPVPKKSKFDDKNVLKAGQQIFEHESAAFQMLSNEMIGLLKLAKTEKPYERQFSCCAVDDSLYQWRVKMGAFPKDHPLYGELELLKKKFGYDTIELQLDFVPEYPFYPPLLRLVRPRLKGSLVQSLANIDILKLTFWNPAKSVHEVLKQIKEILLKHARLDVDNERNDGEKFPEGAYLPLEDYLIKLALATEIRPRANFDVIKVENLEKAPQIRAKTSGLPIQENAQKANGWRPGVGYGSGGRSSGWNPEATILAQQEKDKQILEILKHVVEEIEAAGSYADQKAEDVYSIIEGSCLLPVLEQQLSVGSFIEIGRHLALYQLIFEVIDSISKARYLLPLLCNVTRQKFCIMALLGRLNDSAAQYFECVKEGGKAGGKAATKPKSPKSKTDDGTEVETKLTEDQELDCQAKKIIDLFEKVKKTLSSAKLTFSIEEQRITESVVTEAKREDEALDQYYERMLKPLQFACIEFNMTGAWGHKFAKNVTEKLTNETRAIWKEWTALKESLPINVESSIFVRVDDSKMNLLQALIIGPEKTPYANGCFSFDICFPLGYPSKPPQVTLRTTGGGKVRFNPNLYNCGKVCLSLLGTWSGESGESWNAKTSTLLQVLVSIQSLILVEEPYFNEPGYEKTMNTDDGKRNSEKYNKDTRLHCVRHAMLDSLQQLQPGFEEVIRLHYQMKKDVISKQLDDWIQLDPDNNALKTEVAKMKKLMDSLPKPK